MTSPFPRLSIRTTMLIVVLAALLPAWGLLGWQQAQERADETMHARDKIRLLAEGTAVRLDRLLGDYEIILQRVAERPLVRVLDARRCDTAIESYAELNPDFAGMALVKADGSVLCSRRAGLPLPDAVLLAPWFKPAMASGKFSASGPFRGRQSGQWLVALTNPVRDASGGVTAVVMMSVDLLKLNRRIFSDAPAGVSMSVIDRDDNFLLRSLEPEAWIGKRLPEAQRTLTRGMQSGYSAGVDITGVMRILVATTMPRTAWRVFAGVTEDEVLGGARRRLAITLAISLVILVVAATLAWWLGARIVRSISALAGAAAGVAAGDDRARAGASSIPEIDVVSIQFNRMLDGLAAQRGEIDAMALRHRTVLEEARDIVLLIDADGRIVKANKAAVAAYGYSREELLALGISDLRAPQALPDLETDFQKAGRLHGLLFETVHRRKDGGTFPVEVSSGTVELGGASFRQSFIRDITERKQAEEALAQNGARLATAQAGAKIGSWETDLSNMVVIWSAEMYRIFELSESNFHASHQAFLNFVHPEDRRNVDAAFAASFDNDASHSLAHRVVTSDGVVKWVEERWRVEHDDQRRPVRAVGTCQDITERKQAEEKIQQQLKELKQWNQATLGRESRILELKAEVNALSRRLGAAPRYASAESGDGDPAATVKPGAPTGRPVG